MTVLITGAAGFIGYHLAQRLAAEGLEVVGLDNLNEYYDVRLKHDRLTELGFDAHSAAYGRLRPSAKYRSLRFVTMDVGDSESIRRLFASERFSHVCNLAAQAGVRFSLTNPQSYMDSNVQGFFNILEAARAYPVQHLVYASSSSVYGIDKLMPFGETGAADHPASLYAATKRSNELMAHTYSHLYGFSTTGLRFFTVYGAWGRPDMAYFSFTEAILRRRAIDVYNYGDMSRDFTYIDDIIEGMIRVLNRPPQGEPSWDGRQSGVSPAPARVYNIGNGAPVKLMDFIKALEDELGVEAEKNMLPMQPGDVPATWADCSALERDTGYRPSTTIRDGIREFVSWYRGYYEG